MAGEPKTVLRHGDGNFEEEQQEEEACPAALA